MNRYPLDLYWIILVKMGEFWGANALNPKYFILLLFGNIQMEHAQVWSCFHNKIININITFSHNYITINRKILISISFKIVRIGHENICKYTLESSAYLQMFVLIRGSILTENVIF